MSLRSAIIPLLVLATTACYRPAEDPKALGTWAYDVLVPEAGSRKLTVEATFDRANAERIALGRDAAPFVSRMEVATASGYRALPRRGEEWREPSCRDHCKLRYQIDLGDLAAGSGDDVDAARRVGDATLAPALAWLVHPVPKDDAPVVVRVRAPAGAKTDGFMTGMHPAEPGTYRFRSHDLDEGSFSAFGPMRTFRVELDKGRSKLDVVVLGNDYAMQGEAMKEWVADAGGAVQSLFGRFPVDHATFFVVPAKGEEEVVFGKVLSLAGASVALVVGDKMTSLARHRDWVLVHEMFHLGFPTFRGEGRWLGEGLATYYEPILRARAGWTDEGALYRQFSRNMRRGMRGAAAGLALRDDLDSIYWGGALFCFAADVRIREATAARRSLDDVVRAALARGGDATRVWTVADVVRVADEVTGTRVMSEMVERYATHGDRIDLDGLLASLGVTDEGRDFDDQKPLAWIRRDIVGAKPTVLAERATP